MSFLRDLGAVFLAPCGRAAREAVTIARLRSVVRRFSRLPPGTVPPLEWIEVLKRAWGNPGWSAEVPYLAAVAAEAARVEGPVLECGSGVTTLLLALVAAKRGVSVVTLEHDDEWHARVSSRLRACNAPRTLLLRAPLRPYGDYYWYDVPRASLPAAVHLVVCDGPPQNTPGGRYGVVPVLGDRLASNVTLLLDDVDRPGERDALARWEREAGLVVHRPVDHSAFATVVRGRRD